MSPGERAVGSSRKGVRGFGFEFLDELGGLVEFLFVILEARYFVEFVLS